MFKPAYLALHETGDLKERVEQALGLLTDCHVCPRDCRVNRVQGETGTCGVARAAQVSSCGPHFGEERPLVGRHGSGTIFFAHCNLGCIFCQNYDISHLGHGEEVTAEVMARIMLTLQRMGCHNINFVTPSHVAPQILEALPLAIDGGLATPLVYNTSGYDNVETIELLDGVVDIYMPDFKYWSSDVAARLSNARDYPDIARKAILEMHRQVGDLQMDARGVATRGLLVRHLVLPEYQAGSKEVAKFLAEEVSINTYVNVMDQYRPCYMAHKAPEICRRPTQQEYEGAIRAFLEAGLHRLDNTFT